MGDTDGDSRFHLPPVRDGKPEVLTDLRKKRGDVVAAESDKGGRSYHSLASPLEFCVARRYITGPQYEAGTRLHALWRGSILHARYAVMRFGDPAGVFDAECLPLMPRDYFRAMDAIRGFHAQRLVRQVCCFELPPGKGKPIGLLRDGLDDLVRHFRL
jgi:hypothetical protein